MARRLIPLSCFLLIGLILPCPGQDSLTIIDDLGTPHRIGDAPTRIVSLAPNITEILFALGLEEQVIGLTRYCNFPPSALNKDKIGGLVDPSPEKILALQPDLVIGFRGNPLTVLRRMIKLGLPVFVLEMGTTINSVFHLIDTLGRVTRREARSEQLLAGLKLHRDTILSTLENVRRKPRVFFILYGMGLWTGGRDSFLHNIIEQARGINIAGDIPRAWLHYSRENLVHENPDVVIIITKSRGQFTQAEIWLRETFAPHDLKALETKRVHYLNEDLATRPGPRIMEALEQVAKILHPRLFPGNRDPNR